eukprot:7735086-Alexandrium_andersonii.AAC.1
MSASLVGSEMCIRDSYRDARIFRLARAGCFPFSPHITSKGGYRLEPQGSERSGWFSSRRLNCSAGT